MSYEAGILEDPDTSPPSDMWKLTADPILSAPDQAEDVSIEFERGLPVKISSPSIGTKTKPTELFFAANALARKHGVGRIDVSVFSDNAVQRRGRSCCATTGGGLQTSQEWLGRK